jgi:hypothetical protein
LDEHKRRIAQELEKDDCSISPLSPLEIYTAGHSPRHLDTENWPI